MKILINSRCIVNLNAPGIRSIFAKHLKQNIASNLSDDHTLAGDSIACSASQCICMCLSDMMAQMFPDIIYLLHPHDDWGDLEQLLVVHVIYKGANGHCIFRLKDVGVRGVVNNDGGCKVTTQALQVLDIVALVWAARLPAAKHLLLHYSHCCIKAITTAIALYELSFNMAESHDTVVCQH